MNYPEVTPGLIADANIYRYEKKYCNDNLYYIKDINNGKQSLFLREFSGYSNSMRFEFVEMDYDIFMSNDVVKLDRPPKKFKIGDRVRQIKEGKGTDPNDNGKESVVTWVNLNYSGKDGISIDGTGFNHQQFIRGSEAFELVTEPKKETTSAIKIGSKVRYARGTVASYFGNNWPEKAGLVLGNIYTVFWKDDNSVKIEEDSMKYYMHIDHFDLVTADTYDATVTTKEVVQSQSKEPAMKEPVFKAGDRVRCITKNFAAQVGECAIVKKYDPLDFTIYVCVDGGTDSCWVKARYWEIYSASPEPEENVLLLMLH